MAKYDVYQLHDSVRKLAQSGEPGAENAILTLLKAHGYTEETWRPVAQLVNEAEQHKGELGFAVRAVKHHLAQTAHGNALRRAGGESEAEALAKHLDDQMRALAGAATFNFADPVVGAARSLFEPGSTRDLIAEERQKTQQAAMRLAPVERLGLDVAGGSLLPFGMAKRGYSLVQSGLKEGEGLFKTAMRMALEGGSYGGLASAGQTAGADLTTAQKLAQIGIEGGAGAILGPATAGGIGLVHGGLDRLIGAAKTGLTAAQRKIIAAIQADVDARRAQAGGTPSTPVGAVAETQAGVGPETMLGDTGPSMQRTMMGALNRPGPGASATELALRERAEGREGRLQSLVQQTLPPMDKAQNQIDSLRQARKDLHTSGYDTVLGNPNVNISQQDVRGVIDRIDAMLGRITPGPSTLRATLEGYKKQLVSGYYQRVRMPTGITVRVPPDQVAAFERQGGTHIGATDMPVYTTDPRHLHFLKLDASGEVIREPGTTTGSQAMVSGGNKHVAGSLDELLTEKVPGYSDLNAQSANLAKQIENVETGQTALGKTVRPEDVQQTVVPPPGGAPGPLPMTDVQKGTLSTIQENLATPQSSLATLTNIFDPKNPSLEARLRLILGNDAYERMAKGLAPEVKMAETEQKGIGKPDTAVRLGADSSLSGGGIPTNLSNLVFTGLQKGWSALQLFRDQKIRDEVGKATGLKGDKLEEYLGNLIADVQMQHAKAADYPGTAGAAGGVGGGLLGVPGGASTGLTIDVTPERREPTP